MRTGDENWAKCESLILEAGDKCKFKRIEATSNID
jgi:hypothetical protein